MSAKKKTDQTTEQYEAEGYGADTFAKTMANPVDVLKANGIRLKKVTYHKTVNSSKGEPEYTFYDGGTHRASRNARLWYTTAGILMEQGGMHKLIPLANAADTELL